MYQPVFEELYVSCSFGFGGVLDCMDCVDANVSQGQAHDWSSWTARGSCPWRSEGAVVDYCTIILLFEEAWDSGCLLEEQLYDSCTV